MHLIPELNRTGLGRFAVSMAVVVIQLCPLLLRWLHEAVGRVGPGPWAPHSRPGVDWRPTRCGGSIGVGCASVS